jgi:FemAB-related protein (PEP-CTERM system-associated)
MRTAAPVTPASGSQGADNAAPSKSDLVVRQMEDADLRAWDEFVLTADGATFFHRAGWRQIFDQIFRLKPHYLIAEREGRIIGILPLVHQKSLLFGNALIAAPFCVEGGTLATAADARDALDRAAVQLIEKTGASYVEYRSRKASRPGWQIKSDLYATFSRPISSDDNANLLAIPRKQRAVLRKALGGYLVSEVDCDTDRLFRVYSESVRNLGTPMFPRKYFAALRRIFAEDCDITVILDKGEPVSAVMNFYFKGTVMPYYGGGTFAARRSGANDFLYWEVMRHAALRGCHAFDFGRSKAHTGAFAFKKNWGFEPQWLEYEYYLKPGTQIPSKNPSNPKYASFIEIWKRLPLPLANTLGPLLIRGLG